MANLPSSSPLPPPTDSDTSKQLSSTSVLSTNSSTPKRDDSLAVNREPDTATAVADTNGHYNGSATKPITAPLSPPIPTPPFNESFDSSAQGQRGISSLTLESPTATYDKPTETSQLATAGVVTSSIIGESKISQQPNTSTPAVVLQPTSDVRNGPKVSESPEVKMEDAASSLAGGSTNAAALKSNARSQNGTPHQQAIQDAEMPDAPTHVSSPPSTLASSLIRARSESVEPERPNKRQKTAEPESLPDAAAPGHSHATTNGSSVKAEVSSPLAMDTSNDQPIKSEYSGQADHKPPVVATPMMMGDPMPQHQARFALSQMKNIKRLKDAAAFLTPVDPVKLNLPTYLEIVKNPVSLQEIEKKLINNEYRNPDEVRADFDLMVHNTILFNGPEHAVTLSGRHIHSKFMGLLERIPPAELTPKTKVPPKRPVVSTINVAPPAPPAPSPAPPAPTPVDARVRRESTRTSAPTSAMSPTAASPTFSLTPGGVPQIRRDSIVTADGRPKRPIHAPPPRDLPYSDLKPRRKKSIAEFKFCEGIMKELWKKQHQAIAYPFYNPVDPVALEIPDYFKIIKKPMDMSEIQRKLNHNEYNNANEFEVDVRLMFNNCYKFNPPDSPVYKCGKSVEAIFDERWSQKPSFKEETPTPPVAEDEDEEEDEEESEDEDSPQLEKLEATLSRLTSEIETIRKKKAKKASPPATSKNHKKKASGGGSVGKAGGKAPLPPAKKKSSKKKADTAAPYMTFAQKQELSERINTLSPAKMHQALNLIRFEHPDLAQDGDEIELDIDELAPTTLHKLYKFVSENTLAPDPPTQAPAQTAKGSKAAPSKPRKKNKPMSATEQERKIRELQSQIEGFEGGSPTEDGPRSLASMGPVKQNADSSSDDDSSSGSESEEE
ncbi:hypothetical protein DRE_03283 [Drechslerella stenobrocha 248]|uniref:Bromodomain-containing protein n=1 Tax=Drechslerella stenobrocha 248 TaxID=1043628 RepID=W7I672_9PEZI|nr:hypothetical protein DRE_03283 [Drechslerella stenobrocha 248]